MWKKSVSTFLLFLFTVSPFQPLLAMDNPDIRVDLLSGSESPRSPRAQASPFRYSYDGNAYTDTRYFMQKEGYAKSIPYVAAALIFEAMHLGTKIAAVPLAGASWLAGCSPKVSLYIVGGGALFLTYMANGVLTFRKYTENSELDFGMRNTTMQTKFASSQNSTSGASMMVDFAYDPTLPLPDWENIPLPNFTIPALPRINTSFLTNFTVSVPTLEIPEGVLAVLPPALQDVLTQALNGQLASFTQATNDEFANLVRSANDGLQAATNEINGQLQEQESNLQKIPGEVQNFINAANAQGEVQVFELRKAFEDLGIAEELSVSIPPVTVSSDIEREFGFNNVSATGAFKTGDWVTTILSDNVVNALMTYIGVGGCVIVFGSAFMALIPWPKRIRPGEQFVTALLQSISGRSGQASSNEDDQIGLESVKDFSTVVYNAMRGSQNGEEEERSHSGSNIWQKVQMASQHPIVIALEDGMIYVGSQLAFSGLAMKGFSFLKNFNQSLAYANATTAANSTSYGVNQSNVYNFTAGKFEGDAFSYGASNASTENALSMALFATLSGLRDGDAQVLIIFGGMLIGTVVLFKLVAKVATWKNDLSASEGYSQF